jgi:hypothetical protein
MDRRSPARARDYLAWLDILLVRVRVQIQREPESDALRSALDALERIRLSFTTGRPWPGFAFGFVDCAQWPPGSEFPGHFERLEREYYRRLDRR